MIKCPIKLDQDYTRMLYNYITNNILWYFSNLKLTKQVNLFLAMSTKNTTHLNSTKNSSKTNICAVVFYPYHFQKYKIKYITF